MSVVNLIIFACIIGIIGLSNLLFKARRQLKKYRPVIDLDKTIEERSRQASQISSQITLAQQTISELHKTIAAFSEEQDFIAAGFYKSKYDFGDSNKFEIKLDNIREKQKSLIKENSAVVCAVEWKVGDSRAEGKKMTNRTIKLGLSAFNVQCDNEILKVKFSNIDRAEEKIQKIRENVDKLLEPNHCKITDAFFNLKLEELYLVYEYQELLEKEREEQRLVKEQIREEEKAQREIEKAQQEAEKEEKRYELALEKARRELENKSSKDRDLYLQKIIDLEAKLKEAHDNKERAMSQAQMTKRGHVYVISNIGSFGENVFKIGMTRRLDPYDRVKELGDASVPFEFDVHAMILTEDAPALERKLQVVFNDRRINRVNERKEFFRVELNEIRAACDKHHGAEFKLTLLAEAKEYRQTMAFEQQPTKKVA